MAVFATDGAVESTELGGVLVLVALAARRHAGVVRRLRHFPDDFGRLVWLRRNPGLRQQEEARDDDGEEQHDDHAEPLDLFWNFQDRSPEWPTTPCVEPMCPMLGVEVRIAI